MRRSKCIIITPLVFLILFWAGINNNVSASTVVEGITVPELPFTPSDDIAYNDIFAYYSPNGYWWVKFYNDDNNYLQFGNCPNYNDSYFAFNPNNIYAGCSNSTYSTDWTYFFCNGIFTAYFSLDQTLPSSGIISSKDIYNSSGVKIFTANVKSGSPSLSHLLSDNFDSYSLGSFPDSGGWVLRYAGEGTGSQYVDNSHSVSNPQALRLAGSSCWSAEAYHATPIPNRVRFETKVLVDRLVDCGCTNILAGTGLYNPDLGAWGTRFGGVVFACDGMIYASPKQYDQSADIPLLAYSPGTWYQVATEVDLVSRSFDVYIDGNLLRTGLSIPDSGLPTGIELVSGHGGNPVAWFDDVNLIEIREAPAYALTITLDPPEGGTITSDPAGMTCSGNTCQGSFPQGTSVTLTAHPNDGWEFLHWDDGVLCYPVDTKTFSMDAVKVVIAKFSAGNNKSSLIPVDSSPINSRTPVILVHGNNNESESMFGWKAFLKEATRNPVARTLFKLYLFSYDSTRTNSYNGSALGASIEGLPELQDKNLIILAHSRGGIVARYYMNYYILSNGTNKGKLGGEKVSRLFTLGTPHHGSPGADLWWIYFSFDYNFSYLTSVALSDLYFNFNIWDVKTAKFLLWDDVDEILTDDSIAWHSALEGQDICRKLISTDSDLKLLNKDEQYFSKIVAYGANNYSSSLSKRMTLRIYATVSDLTGLYRLSWVNKHNRLDLATVLMARIPIIPNGYQADCNPDVLNPINNNFWPFQANDGLVPLTSALFLMPGSLNLFQQQKGKLNYDEEELDRACQVAECNVVKGSMDHLDLLENRNIIKSVLSRLILF
ncbi:MAG: hypothetical protein AB9873_13250 [Syntrophobacteraceae bacterium]